MIPARLRARLRDDDLVRKVLGGGAAALAIKGAAAVLSFVMFAAVARTMSLDDFGRFGFAFSLAGVLAVLGSVGQRRLVLRFAPAYLADGDEPRLRGVIRAGYATVGLGCGAIALALTLWAAGSGGAGSDAYVAAAGLLVIAIGWAEYQAHVLRAFGSVVLALAPRDVAWRLAVFLVAAGILLTGLRPISPATAVLIVAVLLLAANVVQAALHPRLRPAAILARPVRRERAQWRRVAMPVWGASLVQSAGQNGAVILAGLLLAAPDTAMLFTAQRASLVLDLVPLAAYTVASPIVSKAWHQKDFSALRKVYALVALGATLAALGAFAVFVVFGRPLLTLFGPAFAEGLPLLLVLSSGYLARAVAGPAGLLLQIAGEERTFLRIVFATNLGALALVTLGALAAGPMGVAVAAAVGIAAEAVWAWSVARARLGVDTSILALVRRPSPRPQAASTPAQ